MTMPKAKRVCCDCPDRHARWPSDNPVHCCVRCYEMTEQGHVPSHTPECKIEKGAR